MEVQQEIKDVFCGPVTAICWVEFDGRKDEGFAYGCCNGAIHVYKWSAIAVSKLIASESLTSSMCPSSSPSG